MVLRLHLIYGIGMMLIFMKTIYVSQNFLIFYKVFFEDLICCRFDLCSHFTLRFCQLLFSVCYTFRTTS